MFFFSFLSLIFNFLGNILWFKSWKNIILWEIYENILAVLRCHFECQLSPPSSVSFYPRQEGGNRRKFLLKNNMFSPRLLPQWKKESLNHAQRKFSLIFLSHLWKTPSVCIFLTPLDEISSFFLRSVFTHIKKKIPFNSVNFPKIFFLLFHRFWKYVACLLFCFSWKFTTLKVSLLHFLPSPSLSLHFHQHVL